ncbi:MAG: CDP-glycerol glycerophosphotransferase family protein, partial [Clostridia bacterium]|nr:CDP-glycerol glycerophosphotransferase family protein [Clostridia bacterium]
NYLYDETQVKLTGMSRFDELKDNPEKQILILPTWRRSIRESYDKNTRSIYYDGFKNTDYFNFYNDLINNERLLEIMREKGYKGLFCLHPIHMKQWVDFDSNDVFKVNEGFINYNDEFERSSLMVTDYSSVLFDFTYLRKPVVYAHFDKDAFFESQIYDEGYFNYENDGFGPVCYDLDSTVDEIIKIIKNDCELEDKFSNRIENFYAFNDNKNCERIYNEIIKDEQ